MISEKIAIVLDTNVLHRKDNAEENMDVLSLELYDNAIEMIEINDLVEKVNVFIPEMVLLELSSHRLDKMSKRLKNIRKFSREFENVPEVNISIHEEFDIEKQIIKIKEAALDSINLIKIPDNGDELFSTVLEMALDKIPPFEKDKSDKGFKDALILLSIIDYAKNGDFTLFVLFTDDNAFNNNKNDIITRFEDETSKKLDIVKSKDIQGYLSEKYDLFIDFKSYLDEIFYLELDDEINKINSIVLEDEGIVCDVNSFNINKDKTTINQVSEFEFELKVTFNLIYRCKDGNDSLIEDVYKDFIFKAADEGWESASEDFNYKVF